MELDEEEIIPRNDTSLDMDDYWPLWLICFCILLKIHIEVEKVYGIGLLDFFQGYCLPD